MIFSEEYYRDLIAKLGLPEMPIKKVYYNKTTQLEIKNFRDDLLKISKKLIQFVSYNCISELVAANFSIDNLAELHKGIAPENVDIFLKTPLEYGGTLEFANMFLVKTRPFKDILNRFIDEQILLVNKDNTNDFIYPTELYVPNPEGIIFKPALSGFAGGGGNTSADKMSEIGGTMFANLSGRL